MIQNKNMILKLQEYLNNKQIFRYSASIKNDVIIKFRSQSISKQKIKYVQYWGIGKKMKLDDIDKSAIEFQKKWMNHMSNIFGLNYEVSYIITDTHANINGMDEDVIESYAKSAKEILASYGFNTIRSSELLKKYGINDINAMIDNFDIDTLLEDSSYQSIIRGLERQASSYSFVGNKENYLQYFKCNLIENAIIEEEFSKHIFVTYGVPETKLLLPNLPKLYTYVDEKRQIKRPWFNEGKA